jgi:glycosyltransferase involved in cell wall biosynthesis
MHKKSICFLLPSIKTSGGGRVFAELAEGMYGKGYEIIILHPNNSQDIAPFYQNKGVKIIAIGNLAQSNLQKVLNLVKCIKAANNVYAKYLLICTDPIMCLFLPLFKHKEIYRFIQADDYRIYDDKFLIKKTWLLRLYKFLQQKSFELKINYIFNSKYVYETFFAFRSDVPIRLVHPAIDHDNFYLQKERNYEKNEHIHISIIARKHPWKGLLTFLDSISMLDEKIVKMIDKITLISHDDLSSFDISHPKFEIVSPTNDKAITEILNDTDIFVSSSWWEGFGLPALEAMACGCAVITSNNGGCNEYARDGYNCLMFEPKDSKCLSDLVSRLIIDGNLRKSISFAGLKTASQFSWSKSVNDFEKIIISKDNNV